MRSSGSSSRSDKQLKSDSDVMNAEYWAYDDFINSSTTSWYREDMLPSVIRSFIPFDGKFQVKDKNIYLTDYASNWRLDRRRNVDHYYPFPDFNDCRSKPTNEPFTILIPYCINNNHWITIQVDVKPKNNQQFDIEMRAYNSMTKTADPSNDKYIKEIFDYLKKPLSYWMKINYGSEQNALNIQYKATKMENTQQIDGASCGPITCQNIIDIINKKAKNMNDEGKPSDVQYPRGAPALRQKQKEAVQIKMNSLFNNPVLNNNSLQPPSQNEKIENNIISSHKQSPQHKQPSSSNQPPQSNLKTLTEAEKTFNKIELIFVESENKNVFEAFEIQIKDFFDANTILYSYDFDKDKKDRSRLIEALENRNKNEDIYSVLDRWAKDYLRRSNQASIDLLNMAAQQPKGIEQSAKQSSSLVALKAWGTDDDVKSILKDVIVTDIKNIPQSGACILSPIPLVRDQGERNLINNEDHAPLQEYIEDILKNIGNRNASVSVPVNIANGHWMLVKMKIVQGKLTDVILQDSLDNPGLKGSTAYKNMHKAIVGACENKNHTMPTTIDAVSTKKQNNGYSCMDFTIQGALQFSYPKNRIDPLVDPHLKNIRDTKTDTGLRSAIIVKFKSEYKSEYKPENKSEKKSEIKSDKKINLDQKPVKKEEQPTITKKEDSRYKASTIQLFPNGLTYCHFYDSNKDNYIFANYWAKGPVLKAKNLTYKTPEHLFQALKFPVGSKEHNDIRNANSADEARKLAGTYFNTGKNGNTPIRDINEIKSKWFKGDDYNAMLFVIRVRLQQDTQFNQMLMSTGTAYIYEDTYKGPPSGGLADNKWGGGDDGQGQNLLGMALMQVRNEEFLRQKNSEMVVNTSQLREQARNERRKINQSSNTKGLSMSQLQQSLQSKHDKEINHKKNPVKPEETTTKNRNDRNHRIENPNPIPTKTKTEPNTKPTIPKKSNDDSVPSIDISPSPNKEFVPLSLPKLEEKTKAVLGKDWTVKTNDELKCVTCRRGQSEFNVEPTRITAKKTDLEAMKQMIKVASDIFNGDFKVTVRSVEIKQKFLNAYKELYKNDYPGADKIIVSPPQDKGHEKEQDKEHDHDNDPEEKNEHNQNNFKKI